MEFILNYIFISVPEFYIVVLWGAVLFGYELREIKFKALQAGLIIALISDIMWKVEFFADIRVFISLAAIFLLYWIFISKDWKKAIVLTLLSQISLIIAEMVVVLVALNFVEYEVIISNLPVKFLITFSFISPLVLGIYLLNKKGWSILKWYRHMKKQNLKLTFYWLGTIVLIAFQVYLISYLNYSFYMYGKIFNDGKIYNINGLPITSIALVIANILLVFFIIKIIKQNASKEIKRTEASYNEYLEKLLEKLRLERHDFVNQVQTINGFVQTNMIEHLRKYMTQLVDNIHSTNRIININNIAVKSLLFTKIEQIESEKVEFILKTETDDEFASIKGYDLAKIVGNLLDNALRAVMEKKADNSFIELYWGKEKGFAIIQFANNGPKIEQKFIDLLFNEGYTTKKNKENNGYGLAIVKAIVDKYKGTIEVESTEERTSFTIKLPLS